jgi:hypothetical protein
MSNISSLRSKNVSLKVRKNSLSGQFSRRRIGQTTASSLEVKSFIPTTGVGLTNFPCQLSFFWHYFPISDKLPCLLVERVKKLVRFIYQLAFSHF